VYCPLYPIQDPLNHLTQFLVNTREKPSPCVKRIRNWILHLGQRAIAKIVGMIAVYKRPLNA